MKRKNIIIIVILSLLSLTLAFPSVLNITAGKHTVESIGHDWELSGDWGYSQYLCGEYGQPFMRDQSTDDLVKIYGSIPHTGDRKCSDYQLNAAITLTDIDWCEVERGIIHRTGTLTISSKENTVASLNTMGIIAGGTEKFGHSEITLDDVIITNNDGVIRVDTNEGSKIIVCNGLPVHFNDTMMIFGDAITYGGNINYRITSVEVTGDRSSNIPNWTYLLGGVIVGGGMIFWFTRRRK